MAIRFGTSGWRAIIADDFTFGNVRTVTEAICSYLKSQPTGDKGTLVIGHDSRFMGETFTDLAAEIAAAISAATLVNVSPMNRVSCPTTSTPLSPVG